MHAHINSDISYVSVGAIHSIVLVQYKYGYVHVHTYILLHAQSCGVAHNMINASDDNSFHRVPSHSLFGVLIKYVISPTIITKSRNRALLCLEILD